MTSVLLRSITSLPTIDDKTGEEEDTHICIVRKQTLIIKLNSEEVVKEDKFCENVLKFYEAGIKYLKLQESSLNKNTDTFS